MSRVVAKTIIVIVDSFGWVRGGSGERDVCHLSYFIFFTDVMLFNSFSYMTVTTLYTITILTAKRWYLTSF